MSRVSSSTHTKYTVQGAQSETQYELQPYTFIEPNSRVCLSGSLVSAETEVRAVACAVSAVTCLCLPTESRVRSADSHPDPPPTSY